ncbi:trypsin-like serine protease [Pseudoalteromonas ulvae]|uniref:Peptidase S1 domain-containing protein n=1 Tax=Pseudoalteromonas ulvae TaxID=107327 RepID=A0A244CRG7_PSEDV|nr:trypsin-like serine protease [Pseudoalteromonas ulvae]OUL58168.1 hypothetical protein B1199_07380 [Pseudoalteromonas ulvae]
MNKLSFFLLLFVGYTSAATSVLVPSNDQLSNNYIEQALVRLAQKNVVGVLIEEQWVVTTASMAQCLTPQSALTLNQQTMNIKQIYLEPDFQHKRGHDIALIELTEKNKTQTPVILQQRKKEHALITYLYAGHTDTQSSNNNHYYQLDQPLLIDGGLLTIHNDQSLVFKSLTDSNALRLLFTDDPKGARLLGLTNTQLSADDHQSFTRIAHYHSWLNQVMLGSVSYRAIIASEIFAGSKSLLPAMDHCDFD